MGIFMKLNSKFYIGKMIKKVYNSNRKTEYCYGKYNLLL